MKEESLVLLDYLEYGIAKITLNNPPLNLNTLPFTRRLEEVVMQIEEDEAVRAVIITGAGDRVFSAGSDVKEFPQLIDNFSEKKLRRENAVFNRIAQMPKPVIAAINAAALGGGCELALTCDFRIIDERAKVGFPEIKLGTFPGSGGMFRLPKLVGIQTAKRMMFLGSVISAQQALEIGLVDEIAPAGRAFARAFELAFQLAKQPAHAIGSIKYALDSAYRLTASEAIELALKLTEAIFKTEDSREGYRSFVEKRQPVFKNAPEGELNNHERC